MKVVSFNIRNVWENDGINSFIHRIGFIYKKIKAENPDVIGFQEILPAHLDVLTKLFPEYEFFGGGRHKNFDGEGLYIAYKKDVFSAVKNEIFWLSDTPLIPESRFIHQSPYPRICIATKLYHKTSGFLTIYNAHLDHITIKDIAPEENARAKGIECILKHIEENSDGSRTIVLGDFNATPDEYCISLMKSKNMTDISDNLSVTFHGFGNQDKFMKIDYIFLSPDIAKKAAPAAIWDQTINGIYLSDHYPIVTEIDI